MTLFQFFHFSKSVFSLVSYYFSRVSFFLNSFLLFRGVQPPAVLSHGSCEWYIFWVLACLKCLHLFLHASACEVASVSLSLCDPRDCGPPGSPVHGLLQAGILEWVAMPSSRGSSHPRDRTCVSCVFCIGRCVLYHWATWEAHLFPMRIFSLEIDVHKLFH